MYCMYIVLYCYSSLLAKVPGVARVNKKINSFLISHLYIPFPPTAFPLANI